jgi:Na+/H+ antiporter NhaC
MRRLPMLLALLLASPVLAQEYRVDAPAVVLNQVPFAITVTSSDVILDEANAGEFELVLNGVTHALAFERDDDDNRTLAASGLTTAGGGPYTVQVRRAGVTVAEAGGRSIAGWLSIVPPLIAIGIALIFKRVIPALFFGIWVGAWIAIGPTGAARGLFDAFQVFVMTTMLNADHVPIILFTLMIGGMVGIISKNGGMRGVVRHIVGWASTRQRGQVATWLMGLVIFFDDYANTLVVGNAMRPITDRLRISREKLAYIVDSTAAPVACLFFVTTWIGYEVGIIGAAVSQIDGYDESAYSIFLNSVPYSFYPWLTILFVLFVAISGKDFGAMRLAERRAVETGAVLGPGAKVDENASGGTELEPPEGKPFRAVNAIVPIIVLVGGVIAGLFVTGSGDSIREIIGSADSYAALMWASLASVLVAALLSIGQRILTIDETVDSWYAGVKSMLFAMIILVLAWALSDVTSALQTAPYLVSVLGDALPPGVVPALIFVISAATAFATGSSWGTMGILMPLVVPLVWAVLQGNGVADPSHYHIIYSTVSCVLAGAVWGDHCSPISDTTILSSMASGCDHIEHVRTQMPYALAVGSVAVLMGTLPTGFGFPWWASMLIGGATLFLLLRQLGESPNESAQTVEAPRSL